MQTRPILIAVVGLICLLGLWLLAGPGGTDSGLAPSTEALPQTGDRHVPSSDRRPTQDLPQSRTALDTTTDHSVRVIVTAQGGQGLANAHVIALGAPGINVTWRRDADTDDTGVAHLEIPDEVRPVSIIAQHEEWSISQADLLPRARSIEVVMRRPGAVEVRVDGQVPAIDLPVLVVTATAVVTEEEQSLSRILGCPTIDAPIQGSSSMIAVPWVDLVRTTYVMCMRDEQRRDLVPLSYQTAAPGVRCITFDWSEVLASLGESALVIKAPLSLSGKIDVWTYRGQRATSRVKVDADYSSGNSRWIKCTVEGTGMHTIGVRFLGQLMTTFDGIDLEPGLPKVLVVDAPGAVRASVDCSMITNWLSDPANGIILTVQALDSNGGALTFAEKRVAKDGGGDVAIVPMDLPGVTPGSRVIRAVAFDLKHSAALFCTLGSTVTVTSNATVDVVLSLQPAVQFSLIRSQMEHSRPLVVTFWVTGRPEMALQVTMQGSQRGDWLPIGRYVVEVGGSKKSVELFEGVEIRIP